MKKQGQSSVTTTAARLASAAGSQTYRYFFTRRTETRQGTLPAQHGIELLHIFGSYADIPLFTAAPEDEALSRDMMARWAALASGPPTGDGRLEWPLYDPTLDPYIDFGDEVSAKAGLRTVKCDTWDRLTGVSE